MHHDHESQNEMNHGSLIVDQDDRLWNDGTPPDVDQRQDISSDATNMKSNDRGDDGIAAQEQEHR